MKSASGQTFTDIDAGLPALLNSQSLDWGDYDNDGDLDLLLAGQHDTTGIPRICLVFRNDSGTFTRLTPGVTRLYHACVRWIDYDLDGDLDFIYSGSLDYGITPTTFLYENADTTFTEHELFVSKSGFIDVADFDDDGDPDFILSGKSVDNPYTGIFRNDSSAFTEIFTGFYQFLFARADFGDYDNDGDLDVVMAGENPSYEYLCLVYRNDSNTVFTDIHADLDSIDGHVSWGDYDNDGDPDLLASGNSNYNTPITKLFNNTGNDQFTSSGITLPQVAGKSSFFDYDSDGDLDILIAGNKGVYPFTTVLRILRNENLVSFTETDPQLYEQYGDIAIGDYDADGDPDFAISGPNKLNGYEYTSRIYNNAPFLSVEKQLDPPQYTIYPNPARSALFIKPETKHNCKTDFYLYDVSGKLMKTGSFSGHAESCMSLEGLPPGLYTLILADEKNDHIFKILKE